MQGRRLTSDKWTLSIFLLLILCVEALDLSDPQIPDDLNQKKEMVHSNSLRGSAVNDCLMETSLDSWLQWEHRKLNIFRPSNASLVSRTWIIVLDSSNLSPLLLVLKQKVTRVNWALFSLVVQGISQATLGWLLRRPDIVLVEEVREFECAGHGWRYGTIKLTDGAFGFCSCSIVCRTNPFGP
jgi:hypothetical protein